MNWKSIKQLIKEELEGELGNDPAPSPSTKQDNLPGINVGNNKFKLRLGAQSVTFLSTLRDPTELRQRKCATRQQIIISHQKARNR